MRKRNCYKKDIQFTSSWEYFIGKKEIVKDRVRPFRVKEHPLLKNVPSSAVDIQE